MCVKSYFWFSRIIIENADSIKFILILKFYFHSNFYVSLRSSNGNFIRKLVVCILPLSSFSDELPLIALSCVVISLHQMSDKNIDFRGLISVYMSGASKRAILNIRLTVRSENF